MLKPISFEKQAPDLATSETIAMLEAALSFRFPPAFAEFCKRWNGGFTSKESEFYPVPQQFTEFYEEFGSRDGGVLIHKLFGATENFEQCDIHREYRLISKELNRGIIPIGVNLFGNRAVLSQASPAGPVYWWDHELWEMADAPDDLGNSEDKPRLIPIAQDLESFYNGLTSDPDR